MRRDKKGELPRLGCFHNGCRFSIDALLDVKDRLLKANHNGRIDNNTAALPDYASAEQAHLIFLDQRIKLAAGNPLPTILTSAN